MPKINFKNFLNYSGYLYILSFLTLAAKVLAADDERTKYVLLEPSALVGVDIDSTGEIDLMTYLKGAYQTLFVVVFSAAIIMLVWAGFEYVLTDVISTKSRAKQRVKDAFFGLAIITLSYLVLYIINQDLVKFNLDLNIG